MENNKIEIEYVLTTAPETPPPLLRSYALWDIDNCLSDDRWRCDLIDWHLKGDERYRRYNSRAFVDAPRHLHEFQLICRLATPIFLTGRPEYMRADTEDWIAFNLKVAHAGLHMRPNGCDMLPADLKQKMLRDLKQSNPQAKIIGAFDDVPAIVQMYHDNRIPAVRLAIHDEHMAYAPEDLAPATPI